MQMQPGEPVPTKKRHLLFAAVPALFLIVIGVIVVLQLPRPAAPKTAQVEQVVPLSGHKGIAMIPRTPDAPKYDELFAAASGLGGVVAWTGDWGDLAKPTSGAEVLVAAGRPYNFTPVVMVTLHNNTKPSKLLRPLTEQLIEQYSSDAASFVQQNHPAYFGMGVEVNNLQRDDPSGYQDFVKLFNQSTESIKKVSPNTKVFTVFQLERMKGLNGGLQGGVNTPSNNMWQLINDFSQADVIGFTTYPYLIYKTPGDIPSDYYTEIVNHVTKPVIFTETAWPSVGEAKGWDSTPAMQADYVDKFFALTKTLDPKLAIWPFAFDPQVAAPFANVGLSAVDGVHKPAWDRWLAN